MKTEAVNLAYVVYTKKEKIRENSSSGGMFYELAKYMIEQENAVVYGAGFSENFAVEHKSIIMMDDIDSIMRSKYVQSCMGKSFIEVKDNLNSGKSVMFVGTPCQVKGLVNYLNVLNIDTEKLLTIDFICHGVPSPKIWEDYIQKLSKKYKSEIIDVNFRDKYYGWHDFNMNIKFKNKQYIKSHYIDEYMFYFLNDYNMRDCCYRCLFRNSEGRVSDITIADAWRSGKTSKKMDKGKSQVYINTVKGKQIFENISANMEVMKTIRVEDALEKIEYENKIKIKEQFFEDYLQYGFSKKLKKKYYGGKKLTKNRIKHFLYKSGLANKIG